MEKKRRQCHLCDKIITGNSFNFKSHLYRHKAVPSRYKCTFCSKEFFRGDSFSKHMGQHTGVPKKTYTCDYCDRSFYEKRNLIIHLKVHDDNEYYRFKCMACGISYCEERLLKYHIRKTHFNLHEIEAPTVKKEQRGTWLEKVKQSEIYVRMTKIKSNILSIKKIGSIKSEFDDNSHEMGNKLGDTIAINNSGKRSRKIDRKTSTVQLKDRGDINKAKKPTRKRNITKKTGEMINGEIVFNVPSDKNPIKNSHDDVKRPPEFKQYISSVFAAQDSSQYSKATCDYCQKEMLKKSLLAHIRERHLKLRRFACDICNATFSRHYQLVDHVCGKYKGRKPRQTK